MTKPFLASILLIGLAAWATLALISDYNAETEHPVMDFKRLPDFTNSSWVFVGNKAIWPRTNNPRPLQNNHIQEVSGTNELSDGINKLAKQRDAAIQADSTYRYALWYIVTNSHIYDAAVTNSLHDLDVHLTEEYQAATNNP